MLGIEFLFVPRGICFRSSNHNNFSIFWEGYMRYQCCYLFLSLMNSIKQCNDLYRGRKMIYEFLKCCPYLHNHYRLWDGIIKTQITSKCDCIHGVAKCIFALKVLNKPESNKGDNDNGLYDIETTGCLLNKIANKLGFEYQKRRSGTAIKLSLFTGHDSLLFITLLTKVDGRKKIALYAIIWKISIENFSCYNYIIKSPLYINIKKYVNFYSLVLCG